MSAVAIVEDHQLLAETLTLGLSTRGVEACIVAVTDLDTMLAQLVELRPSLVLLDLDLGAVGDSTPLIEPLVRDGIRVLILTGSSDRARVAHALELGALGYQFKSAGFDVLIERTTRALTASGPLDAPERSAMLSELASARAVHQRAMAPYDQLTPREQATLRALDEGRSVQQIARDWTVSEATVRSHVRGVLDKTDSPSQLAAVAAARRCGWFES